MKDQGRIEPAEILQVKTKGVKDHEKQNDYKAGTKQIDILQAKTEDGVEYETKTKQAETENAKNYEAGDKPDILQANSAFKNKKYQDRIGTDKPLFGGLKIKTRLGYSVFKNYEKQNNFAKDGSEQVRTK